MIGMPDKYDNVCDKALKETKAKGAILIVVDGYAGSGCSVKLTEEHQLYIPSILRAMARDIEYHRKHRQ